MSAVLVMLAVSQVAVPQSGWVYHDQHRDGIKVASMALLESTDGLSSLVIKCDTPYGNLSIQYVPSRAVGLHSEGRKYWGKSVIDLFELRGALKERIPLHWDFGRSSAFAVNLLKYELTTKAVSALSARPSTLVVEAYDGKRKPISQTFESRRGYAELNRIAAECSSISALAAQGGKVK
jgi:hypothetical protein